MGKIFTAETVAQEDVPQPGDQERVAREFIDIAADIPSLHSAIIFGSTALDMAKRRSDTDIAIAYTDDDPSAFFMELRDTIRPCPEVSLLNRMWSVVKVSPIQKQRYKATSLWLSSFA